MKELNSFLNIGQRQISKVEDEDAFIFVAGIFELMTNIPGKFQKHLYSF